MVDAGWDQHHQTASDRDPDSAPWIAVREIRALADALHVAPSDLTAMPVPAPGNGSTDLAVEAVRVALMSCPVVSNICSSMLDWDRPGNRRCHSVDPACRDVRHRRDRRG